MFSISVAGAYFHCIPLKIAKKDKNGDAAIHLAVMCEGSDTDFKNTVKVLGNLK